MVVFPDADLPAAASALRAAGYWNSGQECGAACRVLVHESVADRFLREVGVTRSHPRWSWYALHTRVSRLFWDLVNEPAPPVTSDAYARRLVARLEVGTTR